MKKIINKINFAIIGLMVASPAFAVVQENAICMLLNDMKGIFNMLRTFCFIGAAFMIAGWAWGYISGGKDGKASPSMDDLKTKGTGLLVGFILLFSVGLILQFLLSASGGRTFGCSGIAQW